MSTEPTNAKCTRCGFQGVVQIETIPKRGEGWKCPECRWWYWLIEPSGMFHPRHIHSFKYRSRFKWISGRWFRKYCCSCGARMFKPETNP